MNADFIQQVIVVGAGLAGSEAAFQLARCGIGVTLVEMRPHKLTPAHSTGNPAELVCSNSLRSHDVFNAVGLLKQEMEKLDSLIIKAALLARVPAGSALAVDRDVFSNHVDEGLLSFSNIRRHAGEVVEIGSEGDEILLKMADGSVLRGERVILSTGPLTAEALSSWVSGVTGQEHLYFYDSIAPIVERDSINMNVAFKASRYGKGDAEGGGEGDYINCPLNQKQYQDFISAITSAELAEVHDFDRAQFFEGCLPVEVMASRGPETLRFGPMKPVGLTNPHCPEERPHAVVQLRQDNLHATLYNMVGFQTRMKWGEQKRIFRMIPGLEEAEFVRMGSMHRNTYLCSPLTLGPGLELKSRSRIHFAGQITGCEGYVESAATGLFAGRFLAERILKKRDLKAPPPSTALGALLRHILHADPKHYQPMNINFGLFDPLAAKCKKSERKRLLVENAQREFGQWLEGNHSPIA